MAVDTWHHGYSTGDLFYTGAQSDQATPCALLSVMWHELVTAFLRAVSVNMSPTYYEQAFMYTVKKVAESYSAPWDTG